MKRMTLFFALLALLAGSATALADGKFYGSESVPPSIPYQRALLLFDGAQETLVLQSKYAVPEPAGDASFGWVVPVPSPPELASMDPRLAGSLFRMLDVDSQPRVTRVSQVLEGVAMVALPLVAVLILSASLLSFVIPGMRAVRRYRKLLIPGSLLLLAGSLCLVAYFTLGMRPGSRDGAPAVEVIQSEQVGVYGVQVVKAGRAGDLIEWLNENQFQFDDTDTQVFDEYLRRGWCFVVARTDPSAVTDQGPAASEGLVAPLIMRFDARAPVYPLALTSTSGADTQVLLYVLGEGKWQGDGRLELEFAGPVSRDYVRALGAAVQPPGFFSDAQAAPHYLCKFKGTLTPALMREDLTLAPADDDEPYRDRIITW